MKKLLHFSLWLVLAVALFGFSFSDSILDYLDNIWDNILFGYNPNSDKISVDSITSTSIVIKSSVLRDEFNDIISDYTLIYGPHTLSEIIDNPVLISDTKEKSFTNLNLAWQTSFTMTLNTSNNINSNEIYYLMSMPKDSAWTWWEVSNEICFRLKDQFYGEWDDCVNGVTHAAGADMSLANISHTINGNNVTLKWIAVAGSDYVEIFLWDESSNNFRRLTNVKMSAETYTFSLSRDWEHIVKFIPNNGWKEIDYTFNAIWIIKAVAPVPEKSTAVKPVVVWPKENIIAVLIWTVVLYLVYRLIRRKA